MKAGMENRARGVRDPSLYWQRLKALAAILQCFARGPLSCLFRYNALSLVYLLYLLLLPWFLWPNKHTLRGICNHMRIDQPKPILKKSIRTDAIRSGCNTRAPESVS
ncbi:hypothetical protein AOLI_G00283830 [Acnodon oligacanthus]